ncbi:methyl-accepting chemotaxis protein [Oxynema aestuarii]|jgi:methyl-accepting chemotaxis protein|uniref:Methyl-accepting transducer domain-containing protein n=1 Tax=Oxynema aestuarii AP17 TaxID=2064643 RepID=A0A6H1TX93_9CYAN|nr:methyl-accepting chemotaxis protein [Oxynema aestuarii]QIZ71222.1 hypothetical protein HCG48_12055 [Oxynema aestuarii AP17]RMH78078.1 MAG: hypothetical protein D6680_03255 [Cyanobacteria bacterium J007]
MLNPLKIRQRILWGYGVPVLLSISISAIAFGQMQSVSRQVNRSAKQGDLLVVSERMSFAIAQMQQSAASFMLDPESEWLESYEEGVKLFENSSQVAIAELQGSPHAEAVREIVDLGTQIDTLNRYAIALIQGNERDRAIRTFTAAESQKLMRQLNQEIAALVRTQHQLLSQQNRQSEMTISSLLRWQWIATSVWVVVAVAIAAQVSRYVSHRLREAVRGVAKFSGEVKTMLDLQQGAIERQSRGVSDTQALLGQLNVTSHQISSQIKGSRDRLEVLDRHVAFLWEQLSEIHQIASVVQELAHQTNLLALNAGVEALRTGSPTGGFDLVALKMRALAYESQQCANQISPLVREMETASGEGSSLDRGVQDFDTLKQAFEDIDGAIAQVEIHSQQEAMTVQQLLVSIEQLESDIAQIASISQESHLSLKELDEASDDLKKLL